MSVYLVPNIAVQRTRLHQALLIASARIFRFDLTIDTACLLTML